MAKNETGRVFPMTDELRRLLVDRQALTTRMDRDQGTSCPWVFHRKGGPIEDYYTAWRTACLKAGCETRIPHDLRRTAVRNLVRLGISRGVAMMMTGHKTEEVFEWYNITSPADFADARELLDKAWEKPKVQ